MALDDSGTIGGLKPQKSIETFNSSNGSTSAQKKACPRCKDQLSPEWFIRLRPNRQRSQDLKTSRLNCMACRYRSDSDSAENLSESIANYCHTWNQALIKQGYSSNAEQRGTRESSFKRMVQARLNKKSTTDVENVGSLPYATTVSNTEAKFISIDDDDQAIAGHNQEGSANGVPNISNAADDHNMQWCSVCKSKSPNRWVLIPTAREPTRCIGCRTRQWAEARLQEILGRDDAQAWDSVMADLNFYLITWGERVKRATGQSPPDDDFAKLRTVVSNYLDSRLPSSLVEKGGDESQAGKQREEVDRSESTADLAGDYGPVDTRTNSEARLCKRRRLSSTPTGEDALQEAQVTSDHQEPIVESTTTKTTQDEPSETALTVNLGGIMLDLTKLYEIGNAEYADKIKDAAAVLAPAMAQELGARLTTPLAKLYGFYESMKPVLDELAMLEAAYMDGAADESLEDGSS